ncbi:MAG: hypothetical protein LBC78_01770 [Oscillospiraceae bacterium]|jgi:hypothetical protein|nr:hypothetical protein [Oscillospiraceae bacterium]
MADSTYTAAGDYFDQGLSAAEKAQVEAYSNMWWDAKARGDENTMAKAHQAAQLVRQSSGANYSGGADGSEYIPLSGHDVPGGGSGGSGYGNYGRSADSYITDMYDRQTEKNLAALKSAYDDNLLAMEGARLNIAADFQAARNELEGNSEIERQALLEYAAAKNLGSGAGAQVNLAAENARLSGHTGIGIKESAKNAEIDLDIAKLETQYKNDIAAELAKGNYAKAEQLYKDFVRVDDSRVTAAYRDAQLALEAQKQAQSAYLDMYALAQRDREQDFKELSAIMGY